MSRKKVEGVGYIANIFIFVICDEKSINLDLLEKSINLDLPKKYINPDLP
jgi:hypothetical protein